MAVDLDAADARPYRPPAMKSLYQLLAIGASLLASCALLAIATAAPPFAPEPGLVLLKNGQILEGDILREGDRYVVTLGERGVGGELKIPVADVDAICDSLDEAYAHKRRSITHRGVKPHLDLADWCLRNKMYDRAADEIVAATAVDPSDIRIGVVERRLKFAIEPKTTRERPGIVLPPGQDEIEAALRTLPPATVEEFAAHIQPLLLNRCAATACHGPSSTAEYRLVRPPLRHVNKTRETQRNLFATLAQINPDGDSPLLEKPLAPHGDLDEPVFDHHDRRQIEQLAAWIEKVKSSPSPRERRDDNVRPAAFEEAAPDDRPATIRLPGIEEPRAFEPEKNARAMPDAAAKAPRSKKPVAPARDPFDPEIFNERYHREK